MKTIKRMTSVCLCALLVLSSVIFTPFVANAEEGKTVYSGIDGRVLKNVIDDIEDDFNLPTVNWTVSGGHAEAVSGFSLSPYSPYEGSRSLMVSAENYVGGNKITLSKRPSSATSISNYKYFAFALWVPEDAGDVSVNLRISAQRGVYSGTQSVDNGIWQTVFFDVSDSMNGTIMNVEISVTASRSGNFYFLIDCFGGCREDSDIFASRYLSSEFVTESGEILNGGDLKVVMNGSDRYIETDKPVTSDLSSGTGIRVDLINSSSCRSLTLKYTTLGGVSDEKYSYTVTIPEGQGIVSCLFPIEDQYISSFSLHFDGAATGEIEIISIGLSPCYIPVSGMGEISECRVSRDKKSISIKGNIDSALEYGDSTVFLYELDLASDSSSITTEHVPLAQAPVSGMGFSFVIPLDETMNGIYKKYAVMIYYGGSLIPVCPAVSVSNPEIYAEERVTLPDGKKGIWPLSGNYILDGVDQTAIEIRADELMTFSSDGAISHVSGGENYYFSSGYVLALDKKMTEYEREGIAVRFILRLSHPDDLSLLSVLCHPLSEGGKYAAFNTTDDEGINALRALTDFLVRRYASSEGVSGNLFGIVVGSDINDAYNNYNIGHSSLNYFIKHYCAALRTVYNAARSVCSDFVISVPLGGDWYNGTGSTQTASFDSRTVLEALTSYIKSGTDIGWELSYDITPKKGSYAWKETPYAGVDARRVSAANLEVLTDFASLQQFYYNGAQRNILLLGSEIRQAEDENDRISLSADYIYTWLRISGRKMKQISGYIPSHPADYEDAFRYVGTNLFEENSSFAADLIGRERYEALLSDNEGGFDRFFDEGSISGVIPSSVKGETVLYSFANDASGFLPSINCASVEGAVSYSGYEGLLRVRLENAELGQLRGVSVVSETPLDLSKAPYISFTLRSVVTSATRLEIFVLVYSGDSVHLSSGIINTGWENTVVCDISSFSGISSCDRIGIYVREVENEDIGEPTLLISSIKALSDTLSGQELNDAIYNPSGRPQKTVSLYTVIAIALLGAAALGAETVRIVIKAKRKEENE